MSTIYAAPGGWTVEHVTLSHVSNPSVHPKRICPAAGDGQYLIVRINGRTMAYARTPAEVATWVDLAALVPAQVAVPADTIDAPAYVVDRKRRRAA